MTPEKIKEIEDSIRNYYRELKQIEIDKIKLTDYEKSLLQAIENKKTYKGIYLDADLNMGMQLSERVQTSSMGTSPQESQFIKKTEWLEDKIIELNDNIVDIKEKIRSEELGTKNIGHGIEEAIRLCKDNEIIVKLRYESNKSYEYIALAIRSSKSNVEKVLKNKILYEISKWIRNNKEIEEMKS